MKRCNHPLCALIADAAAQTCFLEAQDVPDPVKLLQAIVDDPDSQVSESVMVEVERFLAKFKEVSLADQAPVDDDITDVVDVREMIEAWGKSGEGDPV